MEEVKKKGAYFTKEVAFSGKKMVLFSLDGTTWSTRKDELQAIKERHEREKVTFNEIKGIEEEEEATEGGVKAAEDDGPVDITGQAEAEENAPRKRGRPKQIHAAKAPAIAAKFDKGHSKKPANLPKAPPKKAGKATAGAASPKKRASSKPAAKASKGKKNRRAA